MPSIKNKKAEKLSLFEQLQARGFIFQTSDEKEVKNLLDNTKATIYEGFDPSADSLHLGHLMSLMVMHHLQKAGHRVVFILGGGTGRVGDPSGKKVSRKLISSKDVASNGKQIKKQVEKMGLVNFSGRNSALMIDNSKWLGKFSFMDDFMMKIAKAFSVNEMLKMRTFADRLEAEESITLMEFCYPVLQAWDYLELYERYECKLQLGGQDQWSNILQGMDLVRRVHGKSVFALTFPLLTNPSGEKMGKTEKGPVWLDAKKTTPFDFYQYLIQTPDSLVPQMMKLFTFIPLDEIDEIIKNPREAQKRLAYEVTAIVHGEKNAKKVSEDSNKLFGGEDGNMASIPTFKSNGEMALDDILVSSGALESKAEVRRRCESGAIKIDDEKVEDPKLVIKKTSLVRYGKSSFLKIEV
ncbi:tyrosine--tRNA ligase [Candidatus Campbellbacteria bacterium CG22_combo_CG10-13_8_21_14_all_36_13]|uniref:Tyrosine--tRNA ligase n=1 Tax=Candidatus Campbellbacteria bacterium CG22_combo_CG10-13_8_21_14_all_36_13 TaxID=1974529 RepID=A0A2H0DYU5_9BACT|nr:MAG: tyrosine--tRNA ligase [Candidatus Campbellbacteria bacterium CG22_combo_CG10-13_8_21_14_all_36_13]